MSHKSELEIRVWKRRIPLLSNSNALYLRKVQWIIVATAVFHNIACEVNKPAPPELDRAAEEAFKLVENVGHHQKNLSNNNNQNNLGRKTLLVYFEHAV